MMQLMGDGNKIDPLIKAGVVGHLKHKKGSIDSRLKDFKGVLQKKLDKNENNQEGQDIKFSLHATKRIEDRNLEIDNEEFIKLRSAINKLRDKGGQESLIITDKAAYIVDISKNRIVTAIDKSDMGENVFTKIDSTLIIN